MLERIDGWLEGGLLDPGRPTAADFEIAPNIRLLLAFDDLAPAIEVHPAGSHARRLVPRLALHFAPRPSRGVARAAASTVVEWATARLMPDWEQWQVAGNAAEVYQRELVPALFGAWAPRIVQLAEVRPGERVLDVACGTGVVARSAAEAVGAKGRVAALDLNPDMLAVAAAQLPTEGSTIEWVEGSAQALPFADRSFDAVCCQLGLQYFPDRVGALREMARVIAPGGRVVVMVWHEIDHSPGYAMLAKALGRRLGADAEAVMRAPFALGDLVKLSALLEDAGLHGCTIRTEPGQVRFASVAAFLRGQLGGSPLAPIAAAAPAGAIEELQRDVERVLGLGPPCFAIEAHFALFQTR